MSNPLPNHITKYFWGDDLSQLSWNKHQKYITKTLLEKGNQKAVSWLLKKTNSKELKKQLSVLNLDQKSENFWNIYLQ